MEETRCFAASASDEHEEEEEERNRLKIGRDTIMPRSGMLRDNRDAALTYDAVETKTKTQQTNHHPPSNAR